MYKTAIKLHVQQMMSALGYVISYLHWLALKTLKNPYWSQEFKYDCANRIDYFQKCSLSNSFSNLSFYTVAKQCTAVLFCKGVAQKG